MNIDFNQIIEFISHLPMWIPVLFCIMAFMGIVGQWALYSKCDLPGYSCLVPVWNVIVFLKIVGRPAKHSYYVIIPPLLMAVPLLLFLMGKMTILIAGIISGALFIPWAIFLIIIYKEVCQSFGKYSTASYVLIVVFNGLYLFNLALSQEEKYKGPVYKG